jgi:hypothetical protein
MKNHHTYKKFSHLLISAMMCFATSKELLFGKHFSRINYTSEVVTNLVCNLNDINQLHLITFIIIKGSVT